MTLRHGDHYHNVELDGDEIIEYDGKSVATPAHVVRLRNGELICKMICDQNADEIDN